MQMAWWFAARRGRLVRVGVVVTVAAMPVLLLAARAAAQIPIPNPAPDGSVPGSTLMSQTLGWLKWVALWASVAAMLIGAIAVGVGHFGSNYGASSAGRKWLLGGMGCAILAALAWTIASTVYSSAT
jgi:hypothetical protein